AAARGNLRFARDARRAGEPLPGPVAGAARGGGAEEHRLLRANHPMKRGFVLVSLAAAAFAAAYGATVLWNAPPAAPPGMVWVPGGEFTMGTDSALGWDDERPAHRVRVGGFFMDATEV